ncbi:hypothetical protein PV327_002968 [Microctonus hyperodae]|uniref:Uncharacterized protein n=1 Tax=Microctonus hyperodae TaxID=165561 RepID=A0AA39G309_MICHY|nr:hypothetical protein PV327_002968 [Microctonus hyperodae]
MKTFRCLFSSHDDTESNDNNITVAEINVPGTSRDDNVRASTSSQAGTSKIFSSKVTFDTYEEATATHEIVGEEIVESEINDATDCENFNEKEKKCIICDKQRKTLHNKRTTVADLRNTRYYKPFEKSSQ